MNDFTKLYENVQVLAATYGMKILGAILFFVIGLWITNAIARFFLS